MNCIFHLKSSERVIISNNRYYYAPSDEYKKYIIRFKGIKKN